MRSQSSPVEGEIVHLVLALIVDCDPRVVHAFRTAGARARILVRPCRLRDAPIAVTSWRPLVIVTMEGRELGDRVFEPMARGAGASLVITDGDVTPDDAEAILVSAVFDGWLARQAQV